MSTDESMVIGHAVYFTLQDGSRQAVERLIAECQTLEGHAGVQYFSVGARGEGFDRPVNDHQFDVALYIVFKDRAAHDDYQSWPPHKAFIERNRDSWAQVRVFDAALA